MSAIVLFMAGIAVIAGWWLSHQRLTAKPWLEEGEIGDLPGERPSLLPARIGLGVFLAVVGSLFALIISAYLMRMAQHTIRSKLCVQLHRKFVAGPASISIDALPCRVERYAVQFTNRIDKCQCSRLQADSDGGRSPRQPLVAADERLAVRALCRDVHHHLPDAVRRSAKAGTIRSPNHASDCSGGIEMFDQPIPSSCYCSYVAWGDPVGTSSCRKC